ncbi:MAG: hypothetical protein MJ202_02055 [Lentisphaeria bacterium]|nr:hypothetical protein [Lentisphaeria bacterium]
MRVVLCIFCLVLSFLFYGCSQRKSTGPVVVVEKYPEPSVVISIWDSDSATSQFFQERVIGLSSFAFLSNRDDPNVGIEYKALSNSKDQVAVSLFRRENCSKNSSDIKLKFEVVHNSETFSIPEICWNQKDEIPLIYGQNWFVKLASRHTVLK